MTDNKEEKLVASESEKTPILSLRDVDITFGRGRKLFKAVSGASFDVYKAETVSLVGESGSGKTTIGRAIVRINPLSKGSIVFDNRLINGTLNSEQIEYYTKKIEEQIAENKRKRQEEFGDKHLSVYIGQRNEKLAEISAKEKNELSSLGNLKTADENKRNEIVEKYDNLRDEVYREYNPIISKLKKYDSYEGDARSAIRTLHTGKLTLRQRKEVVRKIQMIFQDPAASLNERATIDYIISEGLYNFRLFENEKDRIHKIEKVIKEVGLLPEHLTRYPHEFSGGQRQRVGLARSIVMEPEFIVADEPISALDVSIRAQVLNLLKKFQKELGLTYLFIAHDLSIVRFISDRIVVIHLGKVVEIAETEELFTYPLHPYTKSLMSAIPIPDPILENEKELFVYDRKKMHDYSVHQPSLVDIGNGHFVYGNEEEIEKYKKIRFGNK